MGRGGWWGGLDWASWWTPKKLLSGAAVAAEAAMLSTVAGRDRRGGFRSSPGGAPSTPNSTLCKHDDAARQREDTSQGSVPRFLIREGRKIC